MILFVNSMLFATFILFVSGSLLALVWGKNQQIAATRLGYGFAALASLCGIATAVGFFLDPHPVSIRVVSAITRVSAEIAVNLDALSAFFLFIIAVGGVGVSIFAIGYSNVSKTQGRRAGLLASGYNLFFLMMIGVVLANNAFTFFLFWEGMSVISFFMILFDYEKKSVRDAGLLYLVMTHIGTAFLLVMFGLLYLHDGSNYSYDAMRAMNGSLLNQFTRDGIFVCAMIGFGIKAGAMPTHFWLPKAHPVAPSHVSALLSGVMLKVAIYGFIRVVFDLLNGNSQVGDVAHYTPLWWGIALITVGAISAPLGALYAAVETDLKRALAYSSIENIGIVFMGLGVALLFRSLNAIQLEQFALFAVFFHVLIHMLAKTLLFSGSGVIAHSVHTTDMEAMGGLIKRLPRTSKTMLVGMLTLGGVPPFPGFISEWLLFQSLLGLLVTAPQWGLKAIAIVLISSLGLTAITAAAAFLRVYGMTFLALPRTSEADHAKEQSPAARWGMTLLAVCVASVGLLAPAIFQALAPTLSYVSSHPFSLATSSFFMITTQPIWSQSSPASSLSALSPFVLALPILIGGMIWLPFRAVLRSSRVQTGIPWGCGVRLTARTEYSARSLSMPIVRAFQNILRSRRTVDSSYVLEPYVIEQITYSSGMHSIMDMPIVQRAKYSMQMIIDRWVFVQNGSIRLYLGYILIALVVLLVIAH